MDRTYGHYIWFPRFLSSELMRTARFRNRYNHRVARSDWHVTGGARCRSASATKPEAGGLLRNSETLPPLTILCSLSRQFSERKLPQQFPWQFLGKIVWRGSEMALLGPTNQ